MVILQAMNSTKPTRRQFLLLVTVGATAGAAGLAACGGGGGNNNTNSDMTMGAPDCSAINAAIGSNHGHSATVIEADVIAAADKTYTLTGLPHTHQFTLTAAEFADLAAGKSVAKSSTQSSTDASHNHTVTIRCVG